MSEIILKINNIDVFRGSFQALWDISLEVRKGEMLALIGANTAGKSTLLDAISGLIHPARGRIEFEGGDITHLDPYKIVDRGITHITEGREIFSDMSVLNNLIIGACLVQSSLLFRCN